MTRQVAGLRTQARARSTGTLTSVYHAGEAGLDPDLRWAAVCEEHGAILGARTRRLAERHRVAPEGFCGECAEGVAP